MLAFNGIFGQSFVRQCQDNHKIWVNNRAIHSDDIGYKQLILKINLHKSIDVIIDWIIFYENDYIRKFNYYSTNNNCILYNLLIMTIKIMHLINDDNNNY